MSNPIEKIIKDQGTVLGHPSGLFVLFFTEMWERFSYYGMRALLVLFLTSSIMDGGFGWDNSNASQLYALYTGLVYFTPLFGGMIADQYLGYRKSVIIGAFTMAFGHMCMALETEFFFFFGLLALILGNGLFKPNISSIVGKLYTDEKRKDAAYTIFYMGINAGAFLGIGLCGYIGEKISWSLGFGLAMVFMIAGALQFMLSGKIFGTIGLKPQKDTMADLDPVVEQSSTDTGRLGSWIGIGVAVFGILTFLLWKFSPLTDTTNLLTTVNTLFMFPLLMGSSSAIIGYIVSDPTLSVVEKSRVWVIVVLTGFTVFFWWAFEQAGSSMTIFARDHTIRDLSGNTAMIFKIVNAVLHVGAMIAITWVLMLLFKAIFGKVAVANTILGVSFLGIWAIIIWMLWREFTTDTTEVQASWFSILNSFFIITLAPLVSKFWELNLVKSGPLKFAMGLGLLAFGFAVLAFGASAINIESGILRVSMIWLILAYFFHTMGELCLSPVGLSYVSKLAPLRLVGVMFGVFFIANFIANWAGGMTASYIDPIAEKHGLAFFFGIFAVIPAAAALILVLINGTLKRMMHGIE